MTALRFSVLDVAPEAYAASPVLTVRLRVEELSGAVVHAIALRVQVRIEPQRRAYTDAEERGLLDLFGHRDRWSNTLRPFTWTHCTALVPGFTGQTEADLPLPCTYDFEVSASKYLDALTDGQIPIELLFSGTVFTRGETGFGDSGFGDSGFGDRGFQVEQVSWAAAASHRLPVSTWRAVMDEHFPNSAWIRVGRESFTALKEFKAEHGLLHWDDTLELLLARASAGAP
jgi:hypothetical protein